jgi:hypothetical protein
MIGAGRGQDGSSGIEWTIGRVLARSRRGRTCEADEVVTVGARLAHGGYGPYVAAHDVERA